MKNHARDFANVNGYWYDIPTGDILTPKSAHKLIVGRMRVNDPDLRLLASHIIQLNNFRKGQPESSRNVKIKLVDNWSDSTIAILFKNHEEKSLATSLLTQREIQGFESEDLLSVFPKDQRSEIVNSLTSKNYKIAFTSKEVLNQKMRSEKVTVFTYQHSAHGQDRFFQLNLDDRMLTIVFDGHGGDEVIEYITKHKDHFLAIVAEPFPKTSEDMQERSQEILINFENEMRL